MIYKFLEKDQFSINTFRKIEGFVRSAKVYGSPAIDFFSQYLAKIIATLPGRCILENLDSKDIKKLFLTGKLRSEQS